MTQKNLRTKTVGDVSFVFNPDYSGDAYLVVTEDRTEVDKLHKLVTVKVPVETLKSFVYDYLRQRVKTMTDEDIEKTIIVLEGK